MLSKLETILPVSGVKGRHVYVASSKAGLMSEQLADEIGISDEVEYEASGSTKIGDGKIDGGDGEIDGEERTYPAPKRLSVGEMEAFNSQTMMDVDTTQIPTLSVSSGKRKYSALLNDTSAISLLSSEPTASSDVSISDHAGKKRSTGRDSRQSRKTSARKAIEISNSAILHGMQGTMNRVTDMFSQSVTQPLDPQSAIRNEALHFIQTRDDNLSLNERTTMVRIFMKNIIAAETYVALVNDDLRRSWLESELYPVDK